MLTDCEMGREYIREFNLSDLENRLYHYPEDQEEVTSQATSYNMFGGFA